MERKSVKERGDKKQRVVFVMAAENVVLDFFPFSFFLFFFSWMGAPKNAIQDCEFAIDIKRAANSPLSFLSVLEFLLLRAQSFRAIEIAERREVAFSLWGCVVEESNARCVRKTIRKTAQTEEKKRTINTHTKRSVGYLRLCLGVSTVLRKKNQRKRERERLEPV